jgi:hypothetical protein
MNKQARLEKIADEWLARNDRSNTHRVNGEDLLARRMKRVSIPESGDPSHVLIEQVRAANGMVLKEPSIISYDKQAEWEDEGSPSAYSHPMNNVIDDRLLAPDPEEQLEMMRKQVRDY